jgi:hypothetical protein
MNSSINAIVVMVGTLSLILFLAVPIALPVGCAVACRRGRPVLAAVLGILSLIAFISYARMAYAVLPLGDKRVAECRSASGAEFVVHQICNYSLEPYTTRFYYRLFPSNQWNAFYMDHEDTRWVSGRIEFDEQRQAAFVLRGKETVALFDATARTLTRGAHTDTNAWVLAVGAGPGDEIKR